MDSEPPASAEIITLENIPFFVPSSITSWKNLSVQK